MAFFQEGDSVEVHSNKEGYYESYWEGTIVAKLDSTNEYVVQYKNLVEEDNCSVHLKEVVQGNDIRPVPPKAPVVRYKYDDQVDVFDLDGWWEGTITSGEYYGSYYVSFPAFKATIPYHVTNIRIHQDWIKKGDRWYITSRDMFNDNNNNDN